MQIGIEGDEDKCYIVCQFDDGERCVKGPMPEEEARAWIDGIVAVMNEEGFESTAAPTGRRLPDSSYAWLGLLVTFGLLGFIVLWALR